MPSPAISVGPSAASDTVTNSASLSVARITISPSATSMLFAAMGTQTSSSELQYAGTTLSGVNESVSVCTRTVNGSTIRAPVTLSAMGSATNSLPSTRSRLPTEVSCTRSRAPSDSAPAGPCTVTVSNSATNGCPGGTTTAAPSVGTRTGGPAWASRCSARYRNVAIWALVVGFSGQKTVPSPHPLVIPEAASLATSVAYHASGATSPKPGSGPSANPKARDKNTAIWARVTDSSGQKLEPSPQPRVTPSCAKRSMNAA